jgi:hypothetical protein
LQEPRTTNTFPTNAYQYTFCAKAEVANLIEQLDLTSIDLGSLEAGGRLFELPFGPLSVINLVKL